MLNATAYATRLAAAGAGSFTGNLALDLGAIFVLAFSGPIIFWVPATTEVICAMAGAAGINPALVGVASSAGQCTLFALLYFFGERIAQHMDCLRNGVDRISDSRTLLRRGKYALSIGAGGVGFPPTVPLFTLAPSLRMRLLPMIVRSPLTNKVSLWILITSQQSSLASAIVSLAHSSSSSCCVSFDSRVSPYSAEFPRLRSAQRCRGRSWMAAVSPFRPRRG